MRKLYIATNKFENFNALVMAKDEEDAFAIVKEYADDAGIEGSWDLEPTVLSVATTMVFSCDYLLQALEFDVDGVIDIGDIEEYYQNVLESEM